MNTSKSLLRFPVVELPFVSREAFSLVAVPTEVAE
jgi:hypothetical protein